jgi:sec-independent protein translocase protein TatB
MFDIDSGKLLILGLIALIVIKPKDLPAVMRQVGSTIGQLRRMAAEFQGQFRDALREAELEDLKKDVAKVADFDGLDPFTEVKHEIAQTRSEIESALTTPAAENAFSESIEPPAVAPPLAPESAPAPVAEASAGEAAGRSGAPT